MGTALTGLQIQSTYDSLLKVSDNNVIDGTPRLVSDGDGNDIPIQVSTGGVNFIGPVELKTNMLIDTPTVFSSFRGLTADFGAFPAPSTIGLVYYWTGTYWVVADNNTIVQAASNMLGISTNSASPNMLTYGQAKYTAWAGFSSGDKLYLGNSGGIINTPPTTPGSIVRQVGYVSDGTNRTIHFAPDNAFYEVA